MHPLLLHMHTRPLTLLKFNRDGDLFVSSGKDGLSCLIRTADGERVGTYEGHNGAIYAVDITLDNSWVVTAGADGQVILFEALTGQIIQQFDHGGIMKFVEFNGAPLNQRKIVTANDKFKSSAGNNKDRIMVWEFDVDNYTVNKVLCIDDTMGLPMKATKVKWGPFDRHLVSIHDEGVICIWDANTGEKVEEKTAPHQLQVTSLQFTEDKMLMITTSKDKLAVIWDAIEWKPFKTYEMNRPLNDAAISPLYKKSDWNDHIKRHIILGGGQDAKDVTTTAGAEGQFETVIWHLVFDEEVGHVKGHFGPMNTLAWFPDGMGFITGGEDGYIRINHFDQDYLTSKKYE